MPELPDVEVFRRHLSVTSLHRKIEKTSISEKRIFRDVTPQLVQKRLKGESFETTRRHGKFLLVRLSNGQWLVLHFGMTSRLQFLHVGDEPPGHTRVLLEFEDQTALAYVSQRLLGQVSITEEVDDFVAEHELGPDALDLELQPFLERLQEKRGTIKAALMDQSTIAGVGNVYSDEILFQVKLHPQAETAELTRKDLKTIHRAMHRVLETAIRSHANPQEMPPTYLLPHRDDDMRCPNCDGKLEKLAVSGRNAIYCPHCQAARHCA